MIPRHALLAALMLVSPCADAADFLSGKDLLAFCSADRETLEDIACTTFIEGFVDGYSLGSGLEIGRHLFFCPPDTGIPYQQAREIVTNFIAAHPPMQDMRAGVLAGIALSRTFACRSK